MVFGGRGAPYHFGSRIAARASTATSGSSAALRAHPGRPVPGPSTGARGHARLGRPARHRPGLVRLGRAGPRHRASAWAGGYVGDGVSTTNLAGRTLRDLILGEDTELTRLPWVEHRSRRWEPEPLRWLGVNAGLRAMSLADREERLTGRDSRLAGAMAPLLGH